MSGGFGWTHGIVVFVYCATMAAVGIRMAGRQRTTDDYFLAGRGLPWLAVAMSMYASVTSAVTFMGVPGVAYTGGVSLLVVGAMSLLVAPFLARGFLPLYRRMGVTTSYEYAERRFGRPARVCAAGLFLLSRLAWLGLVIYAPSLALTVATAYTVAGGLAAVVWTDVVQFVLMVGGAVWMAVALAARVDGGTASNLPPDALLPHFAIHELPPVVGGLIVSAVFAAAMSSMDSGINSIATVIVSDFVAPVRGAALTDAAALRLARILTFGLGLAFSFALPDRASARAHPGGSAR